MIKTVSCIYERKKMLTCWWNKSKYNFPEQCEEVHDVIATAW